MRTKTKSEKREVKQKPKMKVSGKKVFALKEIIACPQTKTLLSKKRK